MSSEHANSRPTGSDYILSAIQEEGASRLFGFIGEGNSHLIDAILDADMDFIYSRHEQAAVTMADGFARTSGEIGVCTVTHGPGVTNAATGIACADRDGIPLVILIGDTSRTGNETSLQYLNHGRLTDPISVYQTNVKSTQTLPEKLKATFEHAKKRHGPAIIEIPTDIQQAAAPDVAYQTSQTTVQRTRPDPTVIEEAQAILAEARAPAILAGGGAAKSRAADAIGRLAETIGAPIATTFFAKHLFAHDHPLVSGMSGTFMTPASSEVLDDVDVLVAVGAQLSGKVTRYGTLYSDAKIIQIDIDPQAIGTYSTPTVGVVGDAKEAVDALAAGLEPNSERAQETASQIRQAGDPADIEVEYAPDQIDPRELTTEISNRLPSNTIVAVDSGNNTGFPAVFHPITADTPMLVNGNFGSMGFALPAAIGAQLASEQPVVCYTGDGATMQVIQEIETAVRYDLPVLVVIYNDESYGIIRHRQNLERGREFASRYESPSFVEIASGMGADGAVVRNVEDLTALDEFLDGPLDSPFVLDARTIPGVARPGFPPY